MQTMVPLYGFGGGGGTGAALTVNAPAGCTVTVSKDSKTKTKVAGADGVAVFKGLATGAWTVTITDGEQTAQKTVTITADYATAITFFSATIHVTYPAGSVCTATDGVTTLTAPDTSGTWDCVVPNAGTWTVSLDSGFIETVEIMDNGEEQTINKWFLYNRGDEHTDVTGEWIATSMPLQPGWKGIIPTIQKKDTYLYLYLFSRGDYFGGAYYAKNKIDLTNVNSLVAVVGSSHNPSDAGSSISVLSDIGVYTDVRVAAISLDSVSGETACTLDVSEISGEHYVAFYLLCSPGDSTYFNLHELYAI